MLHQQNILIQQKGENSYVYQKISKRAYILHTLLC